ncbi:MAG: DUF4258 domain-containing protein [Candidatus Pacebacteria bacterium]|nr:DUF4258 domain-containing protein [Candidatus Paceibacterota bacterium]PIR63114.1 MAG: hypothetical protein COU64_06300 [Candidatus Pacebacteria bacterium CG10_big_fil_rev_8_21_14_0_10_40_26]PIZ78500.1 MAG: hypothetical protein COY01_04625 [Candidatus Pacebacteria bacterium CG_4_10_14_0_2_um_filter_40_20]PJA69350.1 MAG: hypothetical protein CO156_00510 [Candidatus Pacebacteria bacterium CG_4_9_14_3_um_filter_40_12]PJC41368.1 MAG: hypothetical protein CO041_04500 [Candidatus Pacebacteria bact
MASHQRTYKNIVFTKHAAERMALRSIADHSVWETITYPESVKSEQKQSKRYIKTINGRRHFVVASYLPAEKKYLVVSTWIRGEDDRVPLAWTLITLPFKLLWKIALFIIKRISKL